MSLDIEDIRPRVISQKSFYTLDDIRRFRHFFYHAYDVELDFERIKIISVKLLENIEFLRDLSRKDWHYPF